MFLPIPVVGQEPGPDYANDVNNSLTLVDGHDHTTGRGVPITPGALNINAALTFNSNFATNVAGITLSPQGAAPPNNTVYEAGVDLFFVDGAGNNIRITQAGGVAGTPGSISNLVPPASASYVAVTGTFTFQSDINTAANIDVASVYMRDQSPNSLFALALSPPAGLASNYQIVLPVLPVSQKIVTLDNNGNMTAPYTVDGVTLTITSNIINVLTTADNGITTAKIIDNAVTTPKILDFAVTLPKLIPLNTLSFVAFTASGSWTAPNIPSLTQAFIFGVGGGGGGGAGILTSSGAGAGGGAGVIPQWIPVTITPGQTYSVTIGRGGYGGTTGGGAPVAGTPSYFGGGVWGQGCTFFGGNPGHNGAETAGVPGAGGTGGTGAGIFTNGGGGSAAPNNPQPGQASNTAGGGSPTGGSYAGGGGGGSLGYGGNGGAGGGGGGAGGGTGAGGGGGGNGGPGGTGGSGYIAIYYGVPN